MTILTNEDRRAIRKRRRTGEMVASIHRDYPQVSISAIYSHCDGIKIDRRKIDAEQAVQLRLKGTRVRRIAAKFGVSKAAVSQAIKRHAEAAGMTYPIQPISENRHG